MEVCGRYHHWMPLLVRVVHVNEFIDWCSSFFAVLGLTAGADLYVSAVKVGRQVLNVASNTSQLS